MRFLWPLLIPCFGFAQTSDPYNGVRVALFGAQTILASPPLPTLEGSKAVTTVQAGYFKADAKNTIENTGYQGTFSGGTAGLGYTSRAKGRANFFALVLFGQVKGDLETVELGTTTKLKDVVTDTSMMAFGMSYRFTGTESAPIAAGVFLSPVIINLKNSFTLVPSTGSPTDYSTNPTIQGAMIGLQYKIRVEKVLFLPYALYMMEIGDSCKSLGAASTPNSYNVSNCHEAGKVFLPASFSAVGFNLGYRSFNFNAYSQMVNDSSMNFITGQQYQLSLTLGL